MNKNIPVSVDIQDGNLSVSISEPCRFQLKDTKANRKVLYIFFRLLTNMEGVKLLTFKLISKLFSLNSRQASHNFFNEFEKCDYDFGDYLKRKRRLEKAFPLIEKQVLAEPLLSIRYHYEMFVKNYPQFSLSRGCFEYNYSRINTIEMKKRIDKCLIKDSNRIDQRKMIQKILEEDDLSADSMKKITDCFPQIKIEKKERKENIDLKKQIGAEAIYFLVMYFAGCGMNYEPMSYLFGVCKGTIHNWFYKTDDMKQTILQSIKWWSGVIAVDEKWVRLQGKWVYVLSAVDNATGFPLFYMITYDLKKESWELFFRRFKRHYGIPAMIISDGSPALRAGMVAVFPKVNHQLCKFHKLKNLIRKIYENIEDEKKREKAIKLAKNIFSNTTLQGRKKAARTLSEMNYEKVSKYVIKNILGDWKKLTGSFTSNAAERWNRKIEKVLLGRYGLKSVRFVEQLLASLYMKEAIRDKRHLEECFVHHIDLKQICQENINLTNFISFITDKVIQKAA